MFRGLFRRIFKVLGKLYPSLCAIGVLWALTGCGQQADTGFEQITTPEDLHAHTQEFEKGIEQITEGVWIAIGYGLANSILIEGDDGLIVIDTLETLEEGRVVAAEFRKLSDKPLKAIIYTHNHTDHVFGAQAFVDILAQDDTPVEVFAHETTEYYVNRIVSEYRPIITARSFRMFGTHLDEAGLVNDGIGPRLSINENSGFGFIKPTQTVDRELETTVAGVKLKLVHAPGETNDQLFIWLPERQVLAVGDNLYKTFPNLYTIRGTPYRSLKDWAASLDKMRMLPVEHIAPSHTRPLHGADEIQRVLTNYRDAIRFVYDQTVRWMNAGLTPDEIIEKVKLPPHLASEPYLQEFYGTVAWSARSVFTGNLGWFDGNPATLNPLPPREEAEKMADLAGGLGKLKQQMTDAVDASEYQWALQLSDWALRLAPEDGEAREARITALTRLGEAASNPNARHYYLMSALELREGLRFRPIASGSDDMIRSLPLDAVMNALATNLRAEDALDMNTRVGISFTDTGENWTIWVRRGVAEVVPMLLDDLDMHLKVEALVWKKMLGRIINPASAMTQMEFEQGGRIAFAKFMLLFKPVRETPEPAPLATLGLGE